MKKLIFLMLCILCLTGCSDEYSKELISDTYNIGDKIELAGVSFNIYKIDDNKEELYLMAESNIASTMFSDSEREQKYLHEYNGSLIEDYVNEFVGKLENDGVSIVSSGIIDKDDLIDLGFKVAGLNGTKYEINNAPEFIKNEGNFWVDGYCKYDTYAWVYSNEILTTEKCEDEYGVRPIIVIKASLLEDIE